MFNYSFKFDINMKGNINFHPIFSSDWIKVSLFRVTLLDSSLV